MTKAGETQYTVILFPVVMQNGKFFLEWFIRNVVSLIKHGMFLSEEKWFMLCDHEYRELKGLCYL